VTSAQWRYGQSTWRTHQITSKVFEYCQQFDCPRDHFISSLLDSDGKVGK